MGKKAAQEILFYFLISESLRKLISPNQGRFKMFHRVKWLRKNENKFLRKLHNHLKMLTYQTGLNSGFLIMNVSPSPFFQGIHLLRLSSSGTQALLQKTH